MRVPRVFTPQSLLPGNRVELEDTATRHLIQVLRLRPGTQLTLFNGDGRDYPALLVESSKRSAYVEILDQSDEEPSPRLAIHLGIGVSKGERMDFAIRKAVELGATTISPLITDNGTVRLTPERWLKRHRHWQQIVVASCEQSGRRRLPAMNEIITTYDWLERAENICGIVLDHRFATTLDQIPRPRYRIDLLAGPEGGLSVEERESALQTGFVGVRLGPRVLRTETTPLAAIAAIQMLWGDFR